MPGDFLKAVGAPPPPRVHVHLLPRARLSVISFSHRHFSEVSHLSSLSSMEQQGTVAAGEAFVGLLRIEITLIATFTQRFFAR